MKKDWKNQIYSRKDVWQERRIALWRVLRVNESKVACDNVGQKYGKPNQRDDTPRQCTYEAGLGFSASNSPSSAKRVHCNERDCRTSSLSLLSSPGRENRRFYSCLVCTGHISLGQYSSFSTTTKSSCMPCRHTHQGKLQPLDCSIFAVLTSDILNITSDMIFLGDDKLLDQGDLRSINRASYNREFTKFNNKAGFRKAILFPLDHKTIKSRLLSESQSVDTPILPFKYLERKVYVRLGEIWAEILRKDAVMCRSGCVDTSYSCVMTWQKVISIRVKRQRKVPRMQQTSRTSDIAASTVLQRLLELWMPSSNGCRTHSCTNFLRLAKRPIKSAWVECARSRNALQSQISEHKIAMIERSKALIAVAG